MVLHWNVLHIINCFATVSEDRHLQREFRLFNCLRTDFQVYIYIYIEFLYRFQKTETSQILEINTKR